MAKTAQLLLDSGRGVYLPKRFAEIIDPAQWRYITAGDIAELKAGPESENYWHSWDIVSGNAETLDGGKLYQDGDLWLVWADEPIEVKKMIIDFQANPHLGAFISGYEECALWSSVDDDDESLVAYELASETQDKFEADCAAFYTAHKELIHCDDAPLSNRHASIGDRQAAMAGHDFWLTRNGHGAGFWDGDWPEDVGETLTRAAKAFGQADLYVGDDGKVYQ